MAKQYGGICHLRFDDTNPAAEKDEFIEAIKEDIKWLGFSPDSSVIGIVTSDRKIHILDAGTGRVKSATSQLESQINAAAFSPDGSKMAATCSSTNASVQVFSSSDGSRLLTVPFQQITRSLAWSPDGKTLAYGAQGGHLQLFDLEAGGPVQTWQLEYPAVRPSPLNEPGDIQFVDDGSKQLFSTGMEGGVEVYDLRSNVKRRTQSAARHYMAMAWTRMSPLRMVRLYQC